MAFRDVSISFPPKTLYIKIIKGEFGWESKASFVQNGDEFSATAPTIWGAIDALADYIKDELGRWASFDANEKTE